MVKFDHLDQFPFQAGESYQFSIYKHWEWSSGYTFYNLVTPLVARTYTQTTIFNKSPF